MKPLEEAAHDLEHMNNEQDALDQSVALNRIVMQLLKTRAQECRRLWIALIISILINLFIVGGFLWYESQWEYTTTTTTKVNQDSGEQGNNMLQIGNNSRMVLDPEEENVNGQAISDDNNNQNTQPERSNGD